MLPTAIFSTLRLFIVILMILFQCRDVPLLEKTRDEKA
ncbi:hypothetical protein PJE062_4001 [Pseudovibrio sp. JE062]|nr:hypothetical protein PJE062_4001 [Pseudovibrio sp. JE062]